MSEKLTKPHTTQQTQQRAAEKRARLTAELRANLARRKTQSRDRASGDKTSSGGSTTP